MITFAVIGHNEAELLPNAIAQAVEACGDGDRVWFVDSASTDGSADVARSLGVEVVAAPFGKGQAMAVAIARCETSHICFVDADIEFSDANIPLSLKRALAEEPADMIVADLVWPSKRFSHAVVGVYRPLVAALFPEAHDRFGRFPFSGFRVLRTDLPLGSLPSGFGVETHLNVLCAAERLRTRVVDVGVYEGPVRVKPTLPKEVGDAILDLAEAYGRLEPGRRRPWDAWVDEVAAVARTQTPGDPDDDYRARFAAVTSRPLPDPDI
jgi:glycosyltransferase involved in cell wall biosynthesis